MNLHGRIFTHFADHFRTCCVLYSDHCGFCVATRKSGCNYGTEHFVRLDAGWLGCFSCLGGKEKSKLATVKAIGSGVEKPEYKVGDRVLYREYAGTNMKVDDEEFIVIKDEDIIASEE